MTGALHDFFYKKLNRDEFGKEIEDLELARYQKHKITDAYSESGHHRRSDRVGN